jgi:SAM-dependent methyltransferase
MPRLSPRRTAATWRSVVAGAGCAGRNSESRVAREAGTLATASANRDVSPRLALRQGECQPGAAYITPTRPDRPGIRSESAARQDGYVDLELLAALRTPEGLSALASASALAGDDQLKAASALRATGVEPGLAAAALTQADLRRKAEAKFGTDAARMFFTRAGLEQATRREVADRRADRLATAGVTRLIDLGCGIGADAFAAARAGIRVTAVDADELTATIAAANAETLGLDVAVTYGTAEGAELAGVDAAFCDPARRKGHSRIFDPAAFSPSWNFVTRLAESVPKTVLKLAPGIDHALIPAGAEAEWVSVDGDVVEAAFWCGPLATVARRATVFRAGQVAELTGDGGTEAPIGPVDRFVYDPDGAVVRAHLVSTLAAMLDGCIGDPTIAYVYAPRAVATRFARGYEIDEVMPFSLKRLRANLRDRGIGRLTIKKRGSALEPSQLRKDLRLTGPNEATIILTRVAGSPTVLFCQPVG